MSPPAPSDRVTPVNGCPVRPARPTVLYWMVAQRRTRFNFGLQHAVALARSLGRPLVVLEGLGLAHPYASARHHRFVLDGMADNARRLAAAGITHHAYLEPTPGAGRGLLARLAADAAVVVTDDWPAYVVPRMVAAAGARVDTAMVAVDSNGVLPLQASPRSFTTAASFRRHLQKTVLPHLSRWPVADPLGGVGLPPPRPLPEEVRRRWPGVAPGTWDHALDGLRFPRDVAPTGLRGGPVAAEARLARFVAGGLLRYDDARHRADGSGTSGLSPFLHYGHISAHEVLGALLDREGWDPGRLAPRATGSRAGWWGLSAAAEAFLDQLLTWRELGFVFQHHHPDTYWDYGSLPTWALDTLEAHRSDPRPVVYDLEALAGSETHDPLWNAAQRQLRTEGGMHPYLRMLWAKKVLEWSPSPEAALAALRTLNDTYALDGRDPNSTSGICWCLGRFDRAWGPERPIFGKVRYMSSASALRKLRLKGYLERYGPRPRTPGQLGLWTAPAAGR